MQRAARVICGPLVVLVCRVFKAAEGNTRNANLFIAFLNANEQAANPLPNFLAGQ